MSAPLGAADPTSTIALGAQLEDLPKVADWLAELAEAEGWPARVRFGLDLSLEEALTNVISYGFAAATVPPRIRVDYFRLPAERVALRIIDNGLPFDPMSVAEPEIPASIEDARIGGHGVQLMRHFLADLSYERVGDENRFTLVADLNKGA